MDFLSVRDDIVKSLNEATVDITSPRSYVFPSELTSSDYSMRKVTIKIVKNLTLLDTSGGFNNLVKKVTEKLKDAQNEIGKKVDISGIIGGNTESLGKISEFTSYKYDFPDSEIEFQVVLPVPNQFTEAYGHSFSTDDGLMSKLPFKGAVESAHLINSRLGHQKQFVNPDKFQNYAGTEPRSFDMLFKLVPTSQEEGVNISKLVYTLKRYSSPEVSFANTVMTQPRFFVVEFGNPVLQKLINPLPCVLRNISCTYDDGTYVSTTGDGMPKVITLSLGFAEVRTKTFNDFGTQAQAKASEGIYTLNAK